MLTTVDVMIGMVILAIAALLIPDTIDAIERWAYHYWTERSRSRDELNDGDF